MHKFRLNFIVFLLIINFKHKQNSINKKHSKNKFKFTIIKLNNQNYTDRKKNTSQMLRMEFPHKKISRIKNPH